MAIPQVNVTIVDGALGLVAPSTSQVQVKLGICSNAVATVQATLDIKSNDTTSGIIWTAVAIGAAGNVVTIQQAAPSGGTTTFTIVGNVILINPKSGETNTGLVAAAAASTQMNALVTGVTHGTGSDTIVIKSVASLAGGITGTINTLFSFVDPTVCATTLGQGPLTDAICHSLAVAGGLCYAMPLNPSVAGSNSAVTHVTGTGGTVTVSGSPFDSYSFLIQCVAGGALGTATFKYSVDGGNTYSAVYTIPSGGTFAVANTGLTLTFGAGTYVVTDLYSFSTTAPGFAIGDVQLAFAVLVANPATWGWAHIVGPPSSSAGGAALAAAVDVLMLSAANTKFRYARAIIETPADTDAAIVAAYATTVLARTGVCVSTATLIVPTNQKQLNRSSAWPFTARSALIPPSEHPGRVLRGALPGVTAIQRDEQAPPGQPLDPLRFITLRTIIGKSGFWITRGHIFTAAGSDFDPWQNARVMDQACTYARAGALQFLNDTIRVNANGTIYEGDAQKIENTINAQLSAAIVSPGWATASTVSISRVNNLLSTGQLLVTVRVQANGYAEDIEINIGFVNPALQVSAAA